MPENQPTDAEQFNKPADGVVETPVVVTPEPAETVENLQDESDKKNLTVGLDKFMDEKTKRKEAEDNVVTLAAELKALKDAGNSKGEVARDIAALAEKYDVDPQFLADLKAVNMAELKAELESEMLPEIQGFLKERSSEKIEKKFSELYDSTLAEMPEYSGIVNRDVIKQLALDPANAKKTLPQILEEAYGNAVPGKKSLENSHSSKDVDEPDFTNLSEQDLATINANPELKKKHSTYMENELKKHL